MPILASSWPSGEELLLALLIYVGLPLLCWGLLMVATAVAGVFWARKMKSHGWAAAYAAPALLMLGVVLIPPGLVGLWWAIEQIPPPEAKPPADCVAKDIDISLLGTPCDPEDQERCGIMDGYYCANRFSQKGGSSTHVCEALCLWDCECPAGYVCMNANCRPEDDPFAW